MSAGSLGDGGASLCEVRRGPAAPAACLMMRLTGRLPPEGACVEARAGGGDREPSEVVATAAMASAVAAVELGSRGGGTAADEGVASWKVELSASASVAALVRRRSGFLERS